MESLINGTVKPVINGHLKEDQELFCKTAYRLMQVKIIAAFCNTFDLH